MAVVPTAKAPPTPSRCIVPSLEAQLPTPMETPAMPTWTMAEPQAMAMPFSADLIASVPKTRRHVGVRLVLEVVGLVDALGAEADGHADADAGTERGRTRFAQEDQANTVRDDADDDDGSDHPDRLQMATKFRFLRFERIWPNINSAVDEKLPSFSILAISAFE